MILTLKMVMAVHHHANWSLDMFVQLYYLLASEYVEMVTMKNISVKIVMMGTLMIMMAVLRIAILSLASSAPQIDKENSQFA